MRYAMAPWRWPCQFTRGLPRVLGFTIIAAVAWIPRHGSLLDLPGRRSSVSSPSPGSGSPRVVMCPMGFWASLIGLWGWGLGRARRILWGSGYLVSWGLCAAISRGFTIVSIGLACTHGICLILGQLLMSSLCGSTCQHWCQIPSKYPWVFTMHLGYDAISTLMHIENLNWEIVQVRWNSATTWSRSNSQSELLLVRNQFTPQHASMSLLLPAFCQTLRSWHPRQVSQCSVKVSYSSTCHLTACSLLTQVAVVVSLPCPVYQWVTSISSSLEGCQGKLVILPSEIYHPRLPMSWTPRRWQAVSTTTSSPTATVISHSQGPGEPLTPITQHPSHRCPQPPLTRIPATSSEKRKRSRGQVSRQIPMMPPPISQLPTAPSFTPNFHVIGQHDGEFGSPLWDKTWHANFPIHAACRFATALSPDPLPPSPFPQRGESHEDEMSLTLTSQTCEDGRANLMPIAFSITVSCMWQCLRGWASPTPMMWTLKAWTCRCDDAGSTSQTARRRNINGVGPTAWPMRELEKDSQEQWWLWGSNCWGYIYIILDTLYIFKCE